MAFGLFAQRWIEATLEASSRKASTKALYAGLARTHIIGSELDLTPLNKIQATTVERFLINLRKAGKSDSTIRQVFIIARAIGDAAVRDRQIAVNPFATVRPPKVAHREAVYLSPAQVDKLLRSSSDSRYRLLFALLVNTGLRRGEALALKWRDVNFDKRTMRVRGTLSRVDGELTVTPPKSGHSDRTLPLSQPAVEVLRSVKVRQAVERLRAGNVWQETGFVFTTEFGTPCDPRNALRALKAAAKAAALDGVGLHTLRHSAASVMLTNGVPLKVVSELLGHSGIAITADVYGHVSPEVSRSAIDVLGSALKAPAAGA